MTLQEARDELERFVQLKTTMRPTFVDVLLDATEVKRGRWEPIVRGENGYSAGDFRCSECGKPNKCYSLTMYCPNCGAKMDEVTE